MDVHVAERQPLRTSSAIEGLQPKQLPAGLDIAGSAADVPSSSSACHVDILHHGPIQVAARWESADVGTSSAETPLITAPVGGGATPQRLQKPLDPEEFRALGHQTVDLIADYFRDVESFPVLPDVKPGFLSALLEDNAPEDPVKWDKIISDLQTKILPGVTHWRSPSFFAYYPSGGGTASLLGEMVCSALGTIGFSWITSPSSTELEMIVLDWLARLLALPESFMSAGKGGGAIQGTASEALLTAMVAARQKAVLKLTSEGLTYAEAMSKLVAYGSDQTHMSMQKACMIAAIESSHFRPLRTDESTGFSLSPSILADAIASDLKNGKTPFFCCATVGTTSSAAIDPVAEISKITEEHGIWLHVDAAYAGPACICPEYRHFLNGIERANSFNINMHKWGLTDFDCSPFWVRERVHLLNALSLTPEYLKYKRPDGPQVFEYRDWQIPLGRRFRALKLWMVLSLHGASGLRAHFRKHIGYACKLKEIIEQDPRFEAGLSVRLHGVFGCARKMSNSKMTMSRKHNHIEGQMVSQCPESRNAPI
ncbi:hypothetical protein CBR_g36295 [Chara braunii]|uniref:Aromatic-L-amino-acid decarboxylase n=1 Tax=Chara braunii TaxID=69332 RepID=A0A388LKK1_CHABU|nr:hypothetical protein CBR_g36295 [Chara braunii]|eukprot:GBG82765.1 hypothetical protein CBR_g36295 [Chara braunii]